MKRGDDKKNILVKALRGASVEDVVTKGIRTDILFYNKKYPTQLRIVFIYNNYPWVVVYSPYQNKFINAWPDKSMKRKAKKWLK